MKKSLIALAVLAASGAAMAQSSVTLYGVADVFVGSQKLVTNLANPTGPGPLTVTSTRNTVVSSGGLNGSRWGLRGSEDLGAGLKGVFVLENGFSIDNGNVAGGATMFGRQAFVGLNSDSFGTVSLGRQYSAYEGIRGSFLSAQGNSPSFDATNGTPLPAGAIADVQIANNPAATGRGPAALRALNASGQAARIGAWTGYNARINNSIRYATPNISGFQAAVVYGFGENKNSVGPAFNNDATKNISGSLSYANGPVGIALAYQDDEIASGFNLKNTAIGGTYDFGMAKAFLSFNRAKYTGFARQNEWAVGARAPLGATTLVAQYAQSNGDDFGKAQSVGMSAEYALSKRTTAYTALNATKLNASAALPSIKNNVFGVGVRHTF